MGKFLVFVILAGSVLLYLTNPTTAEIQAQLGGQLPPEISGAPGVPTDVPAVPTAPLGPSDVQQPPTPPQGGEPGGPPPMMPDVPAATVPQSEMQLDRKDYYLFSIYRVTVGGQQLPGCIVGIAKQAVPMANCPAEPAAAPS